MRQEDRAAAEASPPILGEAEVQRRVLILAELQGKLDELGVRAVLARNHRLTLRYNVPGPQPCGMTDPVLHMFAPSGIRKATTDGTCFRIDSGEEFPADDPAGAATRISVPQLTQDTKAKRKNANVKKGRRRLMPNCLVPAIACRPGEFDQPSSPAHGKVTP